MQEPNKTKYNQDDTRNRGKTGGENRVRELM